MATVAYDGNVANTPVMSMFLSGTSGHVPYAVSWGAVQIVMCSLVGRSPMSFSGPLWSQPIA